MSKGLSQTAATAAIARFIQESSLNPTIPGDKNIPGASIGFGQWNRDRQTNLRNFAGDQWSDPYRQLDFFIHEGSGSGGHGGSSEKTAFDRLVNAQTREEAVMAMMDYERPRGWSAGNSSAGHGYKNTLNNYATLMSGGGGPGGGGQYNLALANDPRRDTPSSGQPIGSELPGPIYPPGTTDYSNPISGYGGGPNGPGAGPGGVNPNAPGNENEPKWKPEKSGWDKFGEMFAKGMGDVSMGAAGIPGQEKTVTPGAALAPTAQGGINPDEMQMRRQKLAEAMARLNSGKLW